MNSRTCGRTSSTAHDEKQVAFATYNDENDQTTSFTMAAGNLSKKKYNVNTGNKRVPERKLPKQEHNRKRRKRNLLEKVL
jgi:hypothetical protein